MTNIQLSVVKYYENWLKMLSKTVQMKLNCNEIIFD